MYYISLVLLTVFQSYSFYIILKNKLFYEGNADIIPLDKAIEAGVKFEENRYFMKEYIDLFQVKTVVEGKPLKKMVMRPLVNIERAISLTETVKKEEDIVINLETPVRMLDLD